MILAIESATPCGSVALVSGDVVLGERFLSRDRQVSETYLSGIAGLLERSGKGPEEISHVAVSAGPGSFTGLRVGMAAAKGFCFGWNLPIVAVPTLHAIAMRFPIEGAAVCPVLDAKKGEVYAALFRWEGERCVRVAPDAAVAPDALPGWFSDGKVLFCGGGGDLFAPLFRERLGKRATFPPEGEGLPRASAVALLAARMIREGSVSDARSVVPAYVRASEAERRHGGTPPAPRPEIDK